MTTFSLTIPPELSRTLDRFLFAGEAAARAVAKTALDARDLLAEATPVDTGDTARRWQVTKSPTFDDPTAVVSNDSVIMVYLEYGTPPHIIKAKNGKALAFPARAGKDGKGRQLYASAKKPGKTVLSASRAQTVFVHSVNHPGTRPTFTVRGNLDRIGEMLRTNMRDEIRRLIGG